MPQGIESLALDGIDDGNEILFVVQIVRSIDLLRFWFFAMIEALAVSDCSFILTVNSSPS